MSTTTLPPAGFAVPGLSLPVKLWTVDEYHRLIELGLLPEGAPLELLDGSLFYKDRGEGGQPMTHGPRHAQRSPNWSDSTSDSSCSGGTAAELGQDQELTGDDVLPGFRTPLAPLFQSPTVARPPS